jgi:hypothetical protein
VDRRAVGEGGEGQGERAVKEASPVPPQPKLALENADQKAMFFLAALIAMLAFLITHNAPTGWFKGIGHWQLVDVVGMISMLGLAVAASMMLAVLYPSFTDADPIKSLADVSNVCIVKYRTLRRGFWVGTVAAFLSLLFLVLSKKPHGVVLRHFY